MNRELQLMGDNLCISTLGSYIHWVNSIPMLSLEEEQTLATQLREYHDLNAARKLVISHLRLVVRMARGYSGYGLSQEDLIQEGNIGLMKAVKRFNPKVGVRLVSFAIHWIRAEIHEFILKNWRIVKIATTKAQRKLFFNLRKASKKLGWLTQAEVETVASELNVSQSDVRLMEGRLNSYDQSLDVREEDDKDSINGSFFVTPSSLLEDNRYSPAHNLEADQWSEHQQTKLYSSLGKLDQRSQDILEQRWLAEKKMTLHELADRYQVSAERIRQLEKNAMKKIRELMQAL